jgi:hypothetical protein
MFQHNLYLIKNSNFKQTHFVRVEVYMVVTEDAVWDVTQCGSYENRRFGGMPLS